MAPKSIYFAIFFGCFWILDGSLVTGDKQVSFSVLLREGNKDMEWDNSLTDQHTPEYRKLVKMVRARIGILFLNITGAHNITINTFRPGVYTDLTISLNPNTSRDAIMTVVNKTDWIDLNTGTPPRSFLVELVFVNHTTMAKIELESLKKKVESILVRLFKDIPGFEDVLILSVTKSDIDHFPMNVKLLFDSRSAVNEDKLKNIILSYKGGVNGSVQFTHVTIKEEKPPSPPKPSRPTWLVVIVALACISIVAGLIAFVYRVFKQSFLKAPKFKLNEEKGDDQNTRRSRSSNSTETLSAPVEPHQNCVAPSVGAL